MTKRFLFIFVSMVAAFAVFSVMLWLNIYYSNEIIIKNNLMTETQLIAEVMRDDYDSYGQFDNKEIRLTVLSSKGDVLFDSYSATTENHFDREEVQSAVRGTPQVVKRYSETIGKDMYYYAVRSEPDETGDYRIIRLAFAIETAQEYALHMMPFFMVCVAVILLLAALYFRYVVKEIKRPLELVGKCIRGLNDGSYQKIEVGERDDLSAVISEVNDLGERLAANMNRLTEEQNKLELVLDNMEEAVIAADEKGDIVFINLSARNLFNCENVLNKNIIYAIDDITLAERIMQAEERNINICFEYYYKERWLEVSVMSADKPTAKVRSVTFIRDMSKDKLAAKQRSDFFESASHELKTPLTSIKGFTELMLTQTEPGSVVNKQAFRIHQEAEKLSELLKDMLDLTEISDGSRPRISVEVDVAEVCREAAGRQSVNAEKAGISITVEGRGKIYAPSDEIYSLADNLISNAVRYNKEGGKVKVEIYKEEGSVVLSVSDTGIGIPEKYRTRIFERFFMVDKAYSKKNGGTGLGLAIVKHIALNLSASLQLSSKEGEGSTFIVKFPENVTVK